jgi:hypothetical protein
MSRFKIGNIVKDKETDKIGKIIDIWRSKHYRNQYGEKRVDIIYCVRLDEPLASKSVYINRYGSSLEKQLFKVKSSMKNFHPALTVYDYKTFYDDPYGSMDFTLATRIQKIGKKAVVTVGFAKRFTGDKNDDNIAIKKAEWRAKHNPICRIMSKNWEDMDENYAHALMDGQYMWLRKYWREFVKEESTRLIPHLNRCKKMDKELRKKF